jgi:hypothetical protein
MLLPRTVLIDTNIFEQYGYAFASQPVEKFLAIAQVKNLTLLLPDAIEREVRRHIKDKSAAAQSALKKARHDAPFLQKWAKWPAPGRPSATMTTRRKTQTLSANDNVTFV